MNTITKEAWWFEELPAQMEAKEKLAIGIVLTLAGFMMIGTILQLLDPAAGILDIGILSVLLFAVLAAFVAIFCSVWLQELLWQPFKTFRKEMFNHFNQLTSWQQCMLYFAVFFLLVYASILVLIIVF